MSDINQTTDFTHTKNTSKNEIKKISTQKVDVKTQNNRNERNPPKRTNILNCVLNSFQIKNQNFIYKVEESRSYFNEQFLN